MAASQEDVYWPFLCGNETQYDAFWSVNLTLETFNPDLSNCFQATILTWIPAAYLVIAAAFYLPYLSQTETVPRPGYISRLCLAKMIVSGLLSLLGLLDFTYGLSTRFDADPRTSSTEAQDIGACIKACAMLLATFLTFHTFRKRIQSSGVLFFFWLLSLLCSIIPFRSRIIQYQINQSPYPESFRFATFYLSFALILGEFILCLFPDLGALKEQPRRQQRSSSSITERTALLDSGGKEKIEAGGDEEEDGESPGKPCPKLTAPFLSQLFFFWFFPTVINGYRRPIQWSDIWKIRDEDRCDHIVPRFQAQWDKELEKLGKTKKEQYAAYTKLDSKPKDGGSETKTPSLYMALFRTFGPYYMSGGLLLFVWTIIGYINPQILQALIAFVESGGDGYTWQGYMLAAAMFVVSCTVVVLVHHSLNISYTAGMRIRTAMTAMIYRKALRLSPVAKKTSTTGEIVNLMSVDTQKLQDAPNFMHYVWSAPFSVALAMYFLWQILGPSCLTGLAFMLVVLPINSLFMAKKIRDLQRSQMKLKDQRIKLMNQVLSGVKVLKLYAWEPFFRDKILEIREKELKNIKYGAILGALTYIIWFCAPFLVALLCFTTYVLSDPDNHILDAQTAFVSMSLINMLGFPLTILPVGIMFLVQAIVSVKRIEKFLLAEEIDPENVQRNVIAKHGAVTIEDGTFSWGEEERVTLQNINVSVPHGRLVAVVGTVGCGKSSLLSAMLGEMMKHEGTVTVNGGIAYTPQQAWIQNLTVRDNILFARPHLPSEYKKVVDACALKPDLDILPGGDLTEIGERGINLSGGQKARVSLARAVYQDADVYLLDDPLSAVDAHVGKHIFDKVIGPDGLLKHKTRVLVTNSISFLGQVDEIWVIKDGTISERGSYEELLGHNGPFAEFIRTYLFEGDSDDKDDQSEVSVRQELERRISALSGDDVSDTVSSISGGGGGNSTLRNRRNRSTKSGSRVGSISKTSTAADERDEALTKKRNELIVKEEVEEGRVKLAVIMAYVKAAGLRFLAVLAVALSFFIAAQCGTSIWLSEWSNDRPVNGTQDRALLDLRLGVYGGLGIAQTVSVLGLAATIALGSVSASRNLHAGLLHNILRCPMAFFDTTPLGRIVNRFSKDVDVVDANIPQFTQNLLTTLAPLMSTIVVIVYSTPIFIVLVIPLAIIFFVLQRVYVACARQIKRIDSTRRSPIYAFFSETLTGVGSVRAYAQQPRFIKHADKLLDNSQRVWFEVFTSNRWIGIQAEFIGDVVVLFAAVLAVVQRDTLNSGLVGLSLSFALQVSMNLIMTVRSTCELETYIVAVERIKEYTETPTEADWIEPAHRPSPEWPQRGTVDFREYSTRYRQDLDLVLKGISCIINPSEKVGVVGRTGAGKSSLTLALFRIIEAAGGSIHVDGLDLASMGLHDARGRLTIIPQDPVLFSGSLRFNIDPSETYSDQAIWQALEQAHLKTFVEALPCTIQYECGEDGENLSVGQRQLVCLARALLRKTKILILDEATAAVDLETDDLIQATIRTEFKECTVITIAHRLNTIMDYDRVMVMDAGKIVEFDKPDLLVKSRSSRFYSMAKDAGLV